MFSSDSLLVQNIFIHLFRIIHKRTKRLLDEFTDRHCRSILILTRRNTTASLSMQTRREQVRLTCGCLSPVHVCLQGGTHRAPWIRRSGTAYFAHKHCCSLRAETHRHRGDPAFLGGAIQYLWAESCSYLSRFGEKAWTVTRQPS